MASRRSKSTPSLVAFLEWRTQLANKKSVPWIVPVGCLGALFGAPTLGYLIAQRIGALGGIFSGVLIAIVLVGIMASLEATASKPKNPQEAQEKEIRDGVAKLSELLEERKLHKWMDPIILQVLEAAAYHWQRINNLLTGPVWSSATIGAHWTGIRDQAAHASQRAMDELILMSIACIGKPERDKSKAVQEIFEDLKDLDVIDALQRLGRVATDDWENYAYHSPQASRIFESARRNAEKLKALADELERQTGSIPVEVTAPGLVDATASQSIDVVLSEMTAIREAEQELERRQTT